MFMRAHALIEHILCYFQSILYRVFLSLSTDFDFHLLNQNSKALPAGNDLLEIKILTEWETAEFNLNERYENGNSNEKNWNIQLK